ncbi:MAG: hypothetical protein OXS32_13535 [Verrucomicrobiales bacterium]|nr:hypothetical protein [Verrucomicrobiales bacterium]|tara:strand:- start:601 stop:1086 length:486 start_codon:yes stop_codon:yes gene_type:complete
MKVYLKILCITAVAMLASCATMDRVSKTDAERVLHEFFRNVDFEVYNRESFRDLITDDFHIYEAGQHMSRNDFFEFIESTHSEATLSNDWQLSDFEISTDHRSAHISYKNVGTFVSKTEDGKKSVLKFHWLENAYFVMDGGRLKIKFIHSEELERQNSIQD